MRAVRIAFWAIALLATIWRLSLYGDPRLAIATTDTQSYIDASRALLLSPESFTGRRLFTTNVVYKAISAGSNCGSVAVSMPAIGKEGRREIQPCFEVVAALQSFLSIGAWLWLAFVVSRRLTEPVAQLLAAVVLLLFAFTPQIAEWDSVMSSESLSISLFILSLGFLIEIAFRLPSASSGASAPPTSFYVLWFVSFALWLYVRDANLFAIPATLMIMIPLSISRSFSNKRPILVLAILLIALFILGLQTSRQSPRWQPSIRHSLETFVFPYPARVQFLSAHFSMPAPNSADHAAWFEERAPTAFSAFLVLHPGFIATTIIDNWIVFIHSYEQPYYQLGAANTTSPFLGFGELLHPASGVFYLVDTIVLIALCAAVCIGAGRHPLPWAWILIWLYLAAASTLVVSFFGDTDGVMRHIFPSLEMFRLLMWLSFLILVDTYLRRSHWISSTTATMATSDAAGGTQA